MPSLLNNAYRRAGHSRAGAKHVGQGSVTEFGVELAL